MFCHRIVDYESDKFCTGDIQLPVKLKISELYISNSSNINVLYVCCSTTSLINLSGVGFVCSSFDRISRYTCFFE